jgi:NADPH2:quinone reductase
MKAIRVNENGGPEVMKVEEIDLPAPEADQVAIDVRAAGVNPVDTYIRAGSEGYARPLPYTPGFDAAGVVDAVGSQVEGLQPGDRVYCAGTVSGSYAEKALCKAAQVHPLPENVTFPQGAGIGIPYGTAWRALFQKAHAQPGETVLVHGASGGVGLAAVQIARHAGLRVIGTASSDIGRKLVLDQGAQGVVDHADPAHMKKVVELAGGNGVNVILEMLANVNLEGDLQSLALGGRVVVIGSRGKIEITPRHTMARDASIIGMALFHATENDLRIVHAAIGAGLADGTLSPIVDQVFPLADAPKAHEAVMQSPSKGNIVLSNE